MKKLIFRLFVFIFLLFFIILSIILISGFFNYKQAINTVSVEDKINEIRKNDNYTKLENISDNYKNAVVCVEDHRFYNHNGVDLFSIIRSSYFNLKRKSLDFGASTLTQQVARLMYFDQEKSFIRKVSEIFVAFDLEKNYSKDEILELYLNLIYFGNGYYGIQEAAKGYFDKAPDDLTFYEATYLAGLPNAPSVYSENNVLAEERRLQVVDAVEKYGYSD